MTGTRVLFLFLFLSICLHMLFFLLPVPATGKTVPMPEEVVPIRLSLKQAPVPAAVEPGPEKPNVEKTSNEPETIAPAVTAPPKEGPRPQPQPDEVLPGKQANTSDSADNTAAAPAAVPSEGAPVERNRPAGNPFAELLQRINIARASAYPLVAKKKGWQGTVIIEVRLDEDGNLVESKIIEKSRHSVLDRAALELVSGVLEQPYPHHLGKEIILKLPISYKLH